MAEKNTLERTYNVPLRRQYQKAPSWKRTERAITGLKAFLKRHMKSENVKIGKELNEKLWKHGIRNPPHHVKITVTKDDKGLVKAELFGVKKEDKKSKKEIKKTSTRKEAPQEEKK